jgi:two-component system copper resistance phosphate regulon response regulator CusR
MKILIVEDDPKIASFLKKGLSEEYFIVDISSNGDEAIYLATLHRYDLIILDLMIYGSDGYEVCRKLRGDKIQTPIIVLSAKSTIDDKVSLLNLGADDYLTKPFSFDELLARIRVHLRKKEQKDNILTIADLQLNLTTKTVQRGENIIKLTAKEYAILEYLLRNKGCIIDETSLQNSIAGFEEIVSSNTVNVYIYRLRAKLDKEYEPKLIKTYRNQGFSINDETF